MMNDSAAYDADSAILSPIEHAFCGAGACEITLLFSYDRVLERTRVQNALTEAVAHFPWMWARLAPAANDYSYRLAPRVESVLLEDGNAAPFLGEHNRFVGPLGTSIGSPLARFCLTETEHGSVLGIRVSHAMTDGSSLFHFLVSWAQITRGQPFADPVRAPVAPAQVELDDATAERIVAEYGFFAGATRESIPTELLREELLYISPPELAELRERAQQEAGAQLSTNDVLMAHLWQKFGPDFCREGGEAESILTCTVDMRALAGLPWNHFGCVLGMGTVRMEGARLRLASLGDVALRVRQSIKSMKPDSFVVVSAALEHLRRRRGPRGVQNLHIRHPSAGMLLTNVTRAPLTELDFGGGPPKSFVSDASQYHAASLFTHPKGIQVRLMPRPQMPSPGAALGASNQVRA
jgi:hypothetical protein